MPEGKTLRASVHVDVYEGGSELGGLAAGFRGRPEWEWPLERFYHHLFTNDDAIIGLTRRDWPGRPAHRACADHGHVSPRRTVPLDSPMSVLQFPHIPFHDRVRMGAALAYLRYDPRRPWQAYDRLLADEWLPKWMGRKAYETVWQPMLQGKFGAALRQGQPRLVLGAHRTSARPSSATTRAAFRRSWTRLRAQRNSRGAPSTRKVQSPASLDARTARSSCTSRTGGTETYDAVLSTLGPGLMAKLAPDLPADYLSKLTSLQSMGAVVLTVALDRQLMREVYWANIPNRRACPSSPWSNTPT